MDLLNRIQVDPGLCNGKPTIRGLRITVRTVLEYVAAGETLENILASYPDLEADDVRAALQYAALAVDHPVILR